MVKSLTYDKIQIVLDTWNIVRGIDNYHEVLGAKIFRHFFEKCPEGKEICGWPRDTDPQEFLEAPSFLAQATLYTKSLDTAVDMMGPDIEMLTEILEELGEKHYRKYGVQTDMYTPMGEGLMDALSEQLGDEAFPQHVRNVWMQVWLEMSADMTRRKVAE